LKTTLNDWNREEKYNFSVFRVTVEKVDSRGKAVNKRNAETILTVSVKTPNYRRKLL
jgi:hypothetical protein